MKFGIVIVVCLIAAFAFALGYILGVVDRK